MKKHLVLLLSLLWLIFSSASAYALTFSYQIGDNDGYGFGIGDNADVPHTNFNNRSSVEQGATDGSQWTDRDDLCFASDPTFSHLFDVGLFASITSASLTIDIQGLEPEHTDPALSSYLYFDGVNIPGIDTLQLGAYGSQVLSYDVDLALLADGQLDVFLNVNGFADVPTSTADLVAVDFTRLEVTGAGAPVPEPATMLLLGSGLLGLAGFRRRFRGWIIKPISDL